MDIIDIAQHQQEQIEALRRQHAVKKQSLPGLIYCESCDEEIDLKRRQALPTARLCIECAEEKERRR